MSHYQPTLDWIDSQRGRMVELVGRWAGMNTGTGNLPGLEAFTTGLIADFEPVGGDCELVALGPYRYIDSAGCERERTLASAVRITKRIGAGLRVFLGIHMDTVYGADHPFQSTRLIDANTLNGPGVADAKGGLAVMLVALEALERSGLGGGLGWEVLINTDEEIGSPGSLGVLGACAKRNHIGLVFEPTHPDGTLIGERGGSGNYTAVVRGKPAHVGRHFDQGCSAIDAMAAMVTALSSLNDTVAGAVVNVGRVEGGGPLNVVPDLAICRFNVRAADTAAQRTIEKAISFAVDQAQQRDGITVQLHGGWTSPPKPMDKPTQALFDHIATCGRDLGLPIQWEPTGGVCDGNKLAAAGLPTVDSLGPRGGHIHSGDEYLLLDSLTERAQLTALLLMKLATGELVWGRA